MGRTSRVLIVAGVMAGSMIPVAASGARAGGTIRPDQTFFGLVNGDATAATVAVACPEAVRPGETGPPVSGQTIAVRSPSPSVTPGGATGARGTTIVAQFLTTSTAATSSITFDHYGSKVLPSTLMLPCLGSGSIVFTPRPTSTTAHSESMTVTYVTPCPGVCAGPAVRGR